MGSKKHVEAFQTITMANAQHHVHGEKGVYCGGDWIPIEECASKWNPGRGARADCANCPNLPGSEPPAGDAGFDVVVIGAGCVGANICRELSKLELRVCCIDRADDVSHGGATKVGAARGFSAPLPAPLRLRVPSPLPPL